jgi:hypothetical protein
MPAIGQDCELILDGNGYFVKPGRYKMKQPRIRKAVVRADGGESYVDLGAGKRVWSLVILCLNDLVKYDGTPTGLTGQQYRDALRSSFVNSTGSTLSFTDPQNGTALLVHFDSYAEMIADLHVQQVALSTASAPALTYEVEIELVEA